MTVLANHTRHMPFEQRNQLVSRQNWKLQNNTVALTKSSIDPSKAAHQLDFSPSSIPQLLHVYTKKKATASLIKHWLVINENREPVCTSIHKRNEYELIVQTLFNHTFQSPSPLLLISPQAKLSRERDKI